MCFGLKQINNKDKIIIIENNLEDILIQPDNVYHYQKYVRQNNVCSFLQVVQSGIHSHTDDQIKTCHMKTCHTKLARL